MRHIVSVFYQFFSNWKKYGKFPNIDILTCGRKYMHISFLYCKLKI